MFIHLFLFLAVVASKLFDEDVCHLQFVIGSARTLQRHCGLSLWKLRCAVRRDRFWCSGLLWMVVVAVVCVCVCVCVSVCVCVCARARTRAHARLCMCMCMCGCGCVGVAVNQNPEQEKNYFHRIVFTSKVCFCTL